jgi:hypothetical protein
MGWFSVFPSQMAAQSPGNKAVYSSAGVGPSTVWVDVSAWWNPTQSQAWPDLCLLIQQNILKSSTFYNTNYPNGTVIDARGLAYGVTGGANQIACSVDPFSQLGSGGMPSTTILLPSGNIWAQTTWHLPNNTRIVGDEQQTWIWAISGFTGGYIIEMGGASTCPLTGCTSVGVEHLQLTEKNGVNVGGIDNQYSQAGSYVNDVNLWLLWHRSVDRSSVPELSWCD